MRLLVAVKKIQKNEVLGLIELQVHKLKFDYQREEKLVKYINLLPGSKDAFRQTEKFFENEKNRIFELSLEEDENPASEFDSIITFEKFEVASFDFVGDYSNFEIFIEKEWEITEGKVIVDLKDEEKLIEDGTYREYGDSDNNSDSEEEMGFAKAGYWDYYFDDQPSVLRYSFPLPEGMEEEELKQILQSIKEGGGKAFIEIEGARGISLEEDGTLFIKEWDKDNFETFETEEAKAKREQRNLRKKLVAEVGEEDWKLLSPEEEEKLKNGLTKDNFAEVRQEAIKLIQQKTPPKDPKSKRSKETPDLTALRDQVQSSIQVKLDEEPKLTDTDLGIYQGWKEELKKLNDEMLLLDFQQSLLSHIEGIRQTQAERRKNKENIDTVNDPEATEEQKKKAWEDIEKNEGQQSYEDDRPEIEKAKKEWAKKNATEYRQRIINNLPAKLAKYEVEEAELADQIRSEIQQLRNGEITEPEELVETETRIERSVGQTGAQKKITNLTQTVVAVLKSKDETQKEEIRTQLTEFINSPNIYYQAHQAQARDLLNELQNFQEPSNVSSSNFPWKIVIPLSLLGLIILVGALAMYFTKKKKP